MARTVSVDRLVDGLDGTEGAKERLKAILANLTGEASVGEAGERVGIGEPMMHRIRHDALQGALEELEPRTMGRPVKEVSVEQERIRTLEAENEQLRIELVAAQVREEIAVAMPHLLVRGKRSAAKKKPARSAPRSARRPRCECPRGRDTRRGIGSGSWRPAGSAGWRRSRDARGD